MKTSLPLRTNALMPNMVAKVAIPVRAAHATIVPKKAPHGSALPSSMDAAMAVTTTPAAQNTATPTQNPTITNASGDNGLRALACSIFWSSSIRNMGEA